MHTILVLGDRGSGRSSVAAIVGRPVALSAPEPNEIARFTVHHLFSPVQVDVGVLEAQGDEEFSVGQHAVAVVIADLRKPWTIFDSVYTALRRLRAANGGTPSGQHFLASGLPTVIVGTFADQLPPGDVGRAALKALRLLAVISSSDIITGNFSAPCAEVTRLHALLGDLIAHGIDTVNDRLGRLDVRATVDPARPIYALAGQDTLETIGAPTKRTQQYVSDPKALTKVYSAVLKQLCPRAASPPVNWIPAALASEESDEIRCALSSIS